MKEVLCFKIYNPLKNNLLNADLSIFFLIWTIKRRRIFKLTTLTEKYFLTAAVEGKFHSDGLCGSDEFIHMTN